MNNVNYDFSNHNCLICNQFCINRRSLGNHLAKSHANDDMSIKNYVLKFYCQNQEPPKCLCGCDQFVSWHQTQYKFNQYVNGHNDAGFKVKQIVFSAEQIQKRNISIKKRYDEDPSVKQKISNAIHNKHSIDENYSKNLIASLHKRWSNPEYQIKMSIAQKQSWANNYDSRYATVFTKEFAQKISASNAKRDCKRTSKVEEEFFLKLKSLLSDVESSKWFNFTDRHVCADAWSKSLQTIFELDGDYYHGLDRKSNFTLLQLNNMTADFEKDLIYISKKMNVFRYSESDQRWREANNIEQFLDVSRHSVVNGEVIRDGLYRFDNDDACVFTRDALLRLSREDRDKLLQPLTKFIVSYNKHRGFFYPKQNQDLQIVFEDINKLKSIAGSLYLQSQFKSFWHVQNGAANVCLNEKELAQVLGYRIGLNNSKLYEYELDNKVIQSNEMFDISPKQIRRGCIVQRKGVSWFKPQWAAKIYQQFCSNKTNPVVWDPSAGFGARQLAFASLFKNGTYIACEPAKLTYSDNINLSKNISQINLDFKSQILNHGSEINFIDNISIKEESCDLVFTSPPFFDREKYFDESGQCWRDHNTKELWIKNYVIPTVLNAQKLLKENAYLVLHLPLDLIQTFEDVIYTYCKKLFRQSELDIKILLNRDHFARKQGNNNQKLEMFIVWKKVINA